MAKKANHTTKPIPAGKEIPRNNQGTKPSDKKGITKGDPTDKSKFKGGKTE